MTDPAAPIRIASRGSALARWQAGHVRDRLAERHPGLAVDVVIVRTTGDRVADVPLSRIGGLGLFTKEVDAAVLAGGADAAVHSLKDLPTVPDAGLALAAVLEREDARDALVAPSGGPRRLADLPAGARVGTSSLRRRSLLLRQRPDLAVHDLRGNLDTRLERLRAGRYDAIVVALAGLKRLGREQEAVEALGPPDWLPAPGQGALAVTVRADDLDAIRRFRDIDHPPTRFATAAERALLRHVEGGCQVPVGALAEFSRGRLRLHAWVGSLDGRESVAGELDGAAESEDEARELGRELAARLLRDGAAAILEPIRRRDPGAVPEVHAP